MQILAIFSVELLLMTLIWLVLAVMSFWVWNASKAKASLLTLIGGGLLTLTGLLPILGIYSALDILELGGAALVVLSYYYTVKPTVDKHIADLKAKAKSKSSSGTPPAAS